MSTPLMNSSELYAVLKDPQPWLIWSLGFLFVTIISLSSCLGIFIIPYSTKSGPNSVAINSNAVLNLFEGLAVGSLLGSSLFHLIPHAFDLVGEDKQHDYLTKSLLVFAGIYVFYWSERAMILFADYKGRDLLDIERHRHEKHKERESVGEERGVSTTPLREETLNDNLRHRLQLTTKRLESEEEPIRAEEGKMTCSCSANGGTAASEAISNRRKRKQTLAWMVIFGDGIHNFIDGLSLGAALSDSILTGFSISVAILFEEIPHELGDFAILLASGMTLRQAAFYNFLSASTCYLGMIFGILLGDFAAGSHLIFALAGGMFLYISIFDIMSELEDGFNEARKVGFRHSVNIILIQNAGILFGISTLFILAKYDEKLFSPFT